jgi:hypothetical protein
MQQPKQIISSQDGAALIIVMLVLVAVTAVGLTAMNISTTEINLAGNDKWQKIGFYNSDPGLHGTPPVIAPNLNPEVDAALPPADPDDPDDEGCIEYINFADDGQEGFHALLYLPKQDVEDNEFDTKDLSFRACEIEADIDVCPRGSLALSGGGVEFASRAEGTGASGSEGKIYLITSTGDGASNSTYTTRGHYRWVDAPGGLK